MPVKVLGQQGGMLGPRPVMPVTDDDLIELLHPRHRVLFMKAWFREI